MVIAGDVSTRLAIQTLEEMEWCLDQLEKMQTHRSVADMATNKVFRTVSSNLINVIFRTTDLI